MTHETLCAAGNTHTCAHAHTNVLPLDRNSNSLVAAAVAVAGVAGVADGFPT